MSACTKYEEALRLLASWTGGRNARLLGVATLGILAGRDSDSLVREIIDAGGEPRLGREEVRRAVSRALRDTSPGNVAPGSWKAPRRTAPPARAGIVRRLIHAGGDKATREELRAISPRRPWEMATDSRYQQAISFLSSLFAPGEYLYLGDQRGSGVKTRAEWEDVLLASSPDAWPPVVSTNPLTGKEALTGDGRRSFRCKASVAARRFALVEFDELPLEEQAAFWIGVVREKALPVVSVVFSGHRSLHGLVRIDAETPDAWAKAWARLAASLCSSLDPKEERADLACRDESRLTDLPGALHREKAEGVPFQSRRSIGLQELLYLSAWERTC